MADFGSPVAQNVNVNPQQGIQTLSGLLALKRQQVGLEQQQQELETQTAQAYQASQSATERQNLSRVNWKQFVKPDGSADIASATIAAQTAAPTTWPDFMDRFEQASTGGAETKKAWYNLNQTYQNGLRSIYTAWGQDPSKNIVDLQKQIDVYKQTAPDDAQDQIGTIQSHVAKILTGPDLLTGANKSLPDQKRGALSYGQAGLGQEQLKPQLGTAVAKSGALVGTAQAPLTGELQQAPGGMQPGLAPTQQVPYQAAVAGATAAAGARATGVASIDTQRASQVSSSIQPSMAAIGLTQQIDSLADQIHSGKFADEISKAAAALGLQNETYARQLLKKDLGQVQARAITNAPTDESRGTILSGYPEATSDPQTIHTAMDYIRGSFRQNLARGRLLNNYQQSKPDLTGFQHADDALTGTMDPLMTEYQSLKTPQERIGFYKRNFQTAEEAQTFKNKVQGVGHILGANGSGP